MAVTLTLAGVLAPRRVRHDAVGTEACRKIEQRAAVKPRRLSPISLSRGAIGVEECVQYCATDACTDRRRDPGHP